MSGRGRAALAAAAVLLLGAGLVAFLRKGTDGTTELPVYTSGAERMVAGEEIYRPTDAKPFTYPPFFAVPFVPLAGVPEEPPRPAWPFAVWYLVNLAALCWIVAIVRRRLRIAVAPGERPGAAAFWWLTALLAGRHVTAVFENQSHDLLVFLLVALGADALCRRRDARAGGWVGVAAACKATPLLFGLPWVLQRRALAVGGLVAGAAAATLLPDLLFPRRDDGLWVMAWYDTFLSGLRPGGTASAPGAWNAHSFLNQSLSGTLCRLFSPTAADGPFVLDASVADLGGTGLRVVTLLGSAAVLALVALCAWPARGRGGSPEQVALRRFGEVGAVLCGMVLLSPMSSKSHFCVLLFAIAFCVHHFLRRRSAVLGALLAGIFVLGTCTAKGLVGRDAGNWLLAHGTVTWTALLALVATSWVLTRSD